MCSNQTLVTIVGTIVRFEVRPSRSYPRLFNVMTNGVARTLKKLRTSKGDYWIKQWVSSIASLVKMGTFPKRKNSPPEVAHSIL